MLYVNPLSGNALTTAARADSPERRAKALQEYEHYFLLTLVKEMRKTVPESSLLDGGQQSALFREMLDDAWAGEMAASGQFGIAKSIAAQWDRELAAKQALGAVKNPAIAADKGKE